MIFEEKKFKQNFGYHAKPWSKQCLKKKSGNTLWYLSLFNSFAIVLNLKENIFEGLFNRNLVLLIAFK
jgi:hypothetical protein